MTRWRVWVLCSALAVPGVACKEKTAGPPKDDQPSPNASILPAPIASVDNRGQKPDAGRGGIPADSAGRLIMPEAAPPEPTYLIENKALEADPTTLREGAGVTLEAIFRWHDLPTPLAGPEVAEPGLQKARELTRLAVRIDLAPIGRMRFAFASPAFPVPQNAELRAAVEHYGHVLVWPDGHAYRTLLPGTLRALLGERRADASPISTGKFRAGGQGGALGLDTKTTVVKSDTGTLNLEQANVAGIGNSGQLLCRLLLELVAVDPASPACSSDTPLRAELKTQDGGRLGFEVTSLVRHHDLPYGPLLVPPAGAMVKPGELPPQAAGVLLNRQQLAAMRSKPAPQKDIAADAPGEGLMAVNQTDTLRYVLVDGVPVAWVRARSEQYLIGLQPGRYNVSWRDFFGTSTEPAQPTSMPARVVIGQRLDAGP
ncbi:MAG: hypothetical protein R3B13_19030 [Polyangiaceae bacterium]